MFRDNCASVLAQEGYEVVTCGQGDEALELVRRRPFHVAFVELNMRRVDGLTLMRAILKTNPRCLVVMMTKTPSIESGIAVLREGAWDYLPKPFSAIQLQLLAGRAARGMDAEERTSGLDASVRGLEPDIEPPALLGRAPAFRQALELAKRVAPTNASVFITGESGCGKELVARYIHDHSRRVAGAFVPVNCGAIPETLIESELFGHVKGSFTGASCAKLGLIEAAHGGTLFLDELLEMPKGAQTKLLRVLQDGVVRRVGSVKTDATVNIRFISATNANPTEALAQGELRADLLYRLRVVPIHLPPLRQRQEDIPLLAAHFLHRFWRGHRDAAHPPQLSLSAIKALAEYAWPGNVRELRNVIERVAVFADPAATIGAADLLLGDWPPATAPAAHDATDHREMPPAVLSVVDERSSAMAPEGGYHAARERAQNDFQILYMRWLMTRARGNMTAASRIAGVDRTTLYRILKRAGLERMSDTCRLALRDDPSASDAPRPPAPVA